MSKIILIEELSEMTGTSVAELEKILEGFEIELRQGEPCTKGDILELEQSLRSMECGEQPEPITPLWITNQQKKTFKRGKK
mgnify:CR=1 FL=1